MKQLSSAPLLGRLLPLPTNVRLCWKGLTSTKALFGTFVNYARKKFYKISSWTTMYEWRKCDAIMSGQNGVFVSWFRFYKTFFHRREIFSRIIESVFPGRAFLAKSSRSTLGMATPKMRGNEKRSRLSCRRFHGDKKQVFKIFPWKTIARMSLPMWHFRCSCWGSFST